MKYAEFIKGNEGFQYSINIQYDLMNPNKINGYIPTRRSVEILKEYLLNVLVDNREKATVLIGPYGKGKSHLLLILLGLMCGKKDVKELNRLVEKIERVDNNCAEIAKNVLEKKKFLPIVINFNSGDLNQAFLIGLNQALKNEDIYDILPETYFDSALTIIEGWEKYDTTIEFVKKLIVEETKLQLEDFKRKLKFYDTYIYEVFKRIFFKVTSGVEFNPFINTDVVKLYEETNHILKEKYHFDGMIIVFDEFSKFIESSSNLNNAMNLKILQDFAELSNRLKCPQMHLVCITHKTINEYISKIPQDKIDAWRTIEGRFKELLFNNSSQQNYELISNAITKDIQKVKKVLTDRKIINNSCVWSAQDIFGYNKEEFQEYIIEGCFPLNPYSTYALPIISEKVAQNERTLFTYLSKDEPNSLIDLIKDEKNEFDLVTIDKLYDYFESLFKKETFNEAIYDIWIKTDTALKIVYSEDEKKVVKALGVIYIVNDFPSLPPTEQTISNALNMDITIIQDIINNLRNLNIIVLRKSTETLDFIPLSSIDIRGKITSLVETKYKLPNLSESYNELGELKYILPKRYNDSYKMTRFFKRTFMTSSQVLAYVNSEKILEDYKSDGIVIDLIIQHKADITEAKKWLDRINDNRIILVIPKEVTKIKSDIAEYRSIRFLKSDEDFLKEDAAIESQLDILLEDNVQKIISYINEVYNLSNGNAFIYVNGKKHNSIKDNVLSSLISEICIENFSDTPVINNELINKQIISTPVKKARNRIVDMILDGSYIEFDSSKNAPECTIFRAAVLNKGLLKNPCDYSKDIKLVLQEIKSFIQNACDKEITFETLYRNLVGNEKKIGIRKGVLPIYLAFVLKNYKDEAIIYLKHGRGLKKELILETSLLDSINQNPKDYIIKVEKGTAEKDKYVEELTSIFSGYVSKVSNNKYVDIVTGMKRWIQSLSLFTQNHKVNIVTGEEISKEILKVRHELVKYEINYRSFIFTDLLKYLSVSGYEECLIKLKEIKKYLDNHDSLVREYLIKQTNSILDKNYRGSLTGNLSKWYINLNEEQKSHLFDSETNNFLSFLKNICNDEVEAINKLAYIFTNLSIEDWNDNTINIYLEAITNSKNLVADYEVAYEEDNNGLIKIIYESITDEKIEKTFNKTETSPIGGTLLNAIEEAIEEYGDSIDDNEKRNILMDILLKYI